MMTIHPDDIELFNKTKAFAEALANRFGFVLKAVEPKRRPLNGGAGGLCYQNEGRISIVLRWKESREFGGQWWSNPESWQTIWWVTIHEVCHLYHPRFGKGLPDNLQHRQLQAAIRAILREEMMNL